MPATYTSFGFKEKQIVQSAISSTNNLLARVIEQTRRLASSNQTNFYTEHSKNAKKAFISFFGCNDPMTVALHFTYIKKGLVNGNLNLIYDASEFNSKAYIFTRDKASSPGLTFTPNLYVCPGLFNGFSALGTNSTLGTIIHEMSHLTIGTKDYKYGMKNCVENLNDAQKIFNADNYKFYAEVFQYPKYEMRPLSNMYNRTHMPPIL